MPFPHLDDVRPFSLSSVEQLELSQIGCYGLIRNGKIVYVGRGDIRQRLLSHLRGDNPAIAAVAPTHFTGFATADCERAEKELILEYQPICNQKVG